MRTTGEETASGAALCSRIHLARGVAASRNALDATAEGTLLRGCAWRHSARRAAHGSGLPCARAPLMQRCQGEATYLDYFRSFGLLMARDLTRGLFSEGNTNNSLSCIAIPGLGLPSADETWCDCVASPKSLRMAVPERSWDGFTSITSYPRAFAHLSKSKTGGKVWVRVGLGRVDDEKARWGLGSGRGLETIPSFPSAFVPLFRQDFRLHYR